MKRAVAKTMGLMMLAAVMAVAQPPSSFTRDASQPSSQVNPDDLKNVGIDQRLDQQLPLDLQFKDERARRYSSVTTSSRAVR